MSIQHVALSTLHLVAWTKRPVSDASRAAAFDWRGNRRVFAQHARQLSRTAGPKAPIEPMSPDRERSDMTMPSGTPGATAPGASTLALKAFFSLQNRATRWSETGAEDPTLRFYLSCRPAR